MAAEGKRLIWEAKEFRKYWYGDIYPKTLGMNGPGHWCAFQLHRADLDGGAVLLFRRAKLPYPRFGVTLDALNPATEYTLEYVAEDGAVTTGRRSGADLAEKGLEVSLPGPAQSMVVRYSPAK